MSFLSEAQVLARLAELEQEVKVFPRIAQINWGEEPDAEESERVDALYKQNEEDSVVILRRICSIVSEAKSFGISDVRAIVDKADALIDDMVRRTRIPPNDGFDIPILERIPSFADSDLCPAIEVKGGNIEAPGVISTILQLMANFGLEDKMETVRNIPQFVTPRAWNLIKKPHDKSSYLARFHNSIPSEPTNGLSRGSAALWHARFQNSARCEITANSIHTPIYLALSPGLSCMALAAAGGRNNHSPVLSYYQIEDVNLHNETFPEVSYVKSGLKNAVVHMAMDESRKLLLAADRDRVKTFDWANNARAVHTLDSWGFIGALHIIGDKIVRAGEGQLATWSINDLPQHEGPRIIGGKITGLHSGMEDGLGEVEISRGTPLSNLLPLAEKKLLVAHWHPHPSQPGRMLCAAAPPRKGFQVAVRDLDLQTGTSTGRFIGQGAHVTSISTSPDEPHAFVASCEDGYARLFDVRHPLPVLTINAAKTDRGCSAAAYCTPNGVPYIFTGTVQDEIITLWDVRMRLPVYDLSTGNNSVASLVWDSKRNTLWAATECERMDSLGSTRGYRRAKVPKWSYGEVRRDVDVNLDDGMAQDENDEWEDVEGDSEDEDDEKRAWPVKAFHNEDFFGQAYDAGEHTLLRYSFKENAKPEILPKYGDATVG